MNKNIVQFSPDSIGGKVLEELKSEQRVAILQDSPVYDLAVEMNDEFNKSVYETQLVENILQSNHPRSKPLYDYVTMSEENKQWYIENTENIKLVEDGIEILGDVFCLEDEKAPDGEGITNDSGYTYFDFDSAQERAKSQGKRVPSKDDWEKYTNFLPGNDENKVKFLTQVLGLAFAGYRFWSNAYYYTQSTSADYWSSTPNSTNAYNMNFNASSINPANNTTRGYGFSVRCLKN